MIRLQQWPRAMAVSRNMLRDQIREVMAERILQGRYAPGERITESQLAQEFGVSHAPVREALRELETLRMVVSEPFRGARVREISARELSEVYPIRAAIEEVAARAAAKALDGDVARLQAQLDAMIAAAERRDLRGLIGHDVAFHRLIVEASGNQTLVQVWRSLRIEARTLIAHLGDLEDGHRLAASHRPVLEALRAGDARRAGTALRGQVQDCAKGGEGPIDKRSSII
jgi:DNA-binding GntR family transcriptional regulator